jgi:hypothetical protein
MNRKQTIKDAIDVLKEHPFTLIQLSDKEKFHTGMLCYALNKHKSLFKTIFNLPGEDYTASVEEDSIDLLIRKKVDEGEGDLKLIVESKFKTGLHKSRAPKSFPDKVLVEKGSTVYISQLEKIKHNHKELGDNGYYLLSLFPEINKNEFGFIPIQFTNTVLEKVGKINAKEDTLISLWVEYLKHLKVIVNYFLTNEMNCINLTKSVSPDDSSLSDLLKGIKLNGVFESYRYGLVQQKVEAKLTNEIKELLISCKNRNELKQVGELFNSHGNGGIHYAFGCEKKSFGIQWQGVLKLFIETTKKSVKNKVKDMQQNLGITELKFKNGKPLSITNGLFSSITIKNDWNIYGDIKERPEEIVKYLKSLNQSDILEIVKNQE